MEAFDGIVITFLSLSDPSAILLGNDKSAPRFIDQPILPDLSISIKTFAGISPAPDPGGNDFANDLFITKICKIIKLIINEIIFFFISFI